MPELLCPGNPKCKRHFKSEMGMRGHATGCEEAQKHVLKRPVLGQHPVHARGTKVAERAIFVDNHESGNDKICRQKKIVFTADCLLNPRFM
ncbi:hypothetical protein NP493_123g01031 [Ridgeia piscesae]|uniref:Uncharacterized protein n=1 Tax=Ridgeia piscesae TaxID=27915 RepID=A0AAD9P653_RIDPI|nr:hypothetical protein NP493_123g01031 [Ridgeia piscesae]